ncbi:MAG: type 1 glutamine amidotransferase [Acidimicrobiales bacterium]
MARPDPMPSAVNATPVGPVDKSWLVLQHAAHEGPGLVADELDRTGRAFHVVRLDEGEPVPTGELPSGLVVMGGPMSVHDEEEHRWLRPERSLIVAMAETDRPVLGICLGAQQLAVALGAEVCPAREAEVGLGTVELTPSGRRDRVFGPEYGGLAVTGVPCVQWHRDTFSLPEGAVHLAATSVVPNQAFRWGASVYALQFHIEVDARLAAAWRLALPEGVALDQVALATVEITGRRLLRRFLDLDLDQRLTGDGASPPAVT